MKPPASPPPPSNTRAFFDPEKLRTSVLHKAEAAFKTALNKIETDRYKLHAKDFEVEHGKHYTIAEQKQILLEKRDLAVPIKATIQLIDRSTGHVVEEKKTIVANIPWVTPRNTVVLNGSEYHPLSQARLLPGVYTRQRETGEIESHVNVAQGTGLGGKVLYNAEKELFVFMVGGTQIKLYGFLKALGVTDAEFEKAWGAEVLSKNKIASDGREVEKYYDLVFNRK